MPDFENTIDRFIDVPPTDVVYVYAFLQRYEGVLSLRAPEPQEKEGVVTLHLMISPSLKAEADQILTALHSEVSWTDNPNGHAGTR